MAASISTRLADVEEQIDAISEMIDDESGASPALRAVIEELHRKTREARDDLRAADEESIRDKVIEVEQAADSARRAAEAEEDLGDDLLDAVESVHDRLSAMKSELYR